MSSAQAAAKFAYSAAIPNLRARTVILERARRWTGCSSTTDIFVVNAAYLAARSFDQAVGAAHRRAPFVLLAGPFAASSERDAEAHFGTPLREVPAPLIDNVRNSAEDLARRPARPDDRLAPLRWHVESDAAARSTTWYEEASLHAETQGYDLLSIARLVGDNGSRNILDLTDGSMVERPPSVRILTLACETKVAVQVTVALGGPQ